jgi:serine/threonine protein kinase
VTVVQEPQYPSGLSYDAVSFMMQALDKNPQKRPTVKQLLAHPWVDRLAQQHQQQKQQAPQQQLSHLQ